MLTQIEIDTMRSTQSNLAEIAKQLKLQNYISFLQLRIANGGFVDKPEFNEIKTQLGIKD